MIAKEVLECLCIEGWSYAITDYMSSNRIDDPEIKKAWDDAKKALNQLESKLRNLLGSDEYDEIVESI